MLIPSKLTCSYRLQNSIKRQRLLKILQNAKQYPLVLINAPAGYGKTTLISQWVANQQNVGWYSLDESDNETQRFATYFSAALHNALDNQLDLLKNTNLQANLSSLFDQLLFNISSVKQPFYLIIDDYHLIDNGEIHTALKYWIRHQPHNMTLILISRSVPPIDIAKLRVQEQLLEIDINQLSFNHQESLLFLQNRLDTPLSDSEVASLCDHVEGWPTALQLIGLSAKQHNTSLHEAVKRLSKLNNLHISEYLNDEVLNHIDQETKDFLLRCAILRSMNEKLVYQLTGCIDSRRKLETLEKQGLFIQQIEVKGQYWWRFHPLFASFLTQSCLIELRTEWQSLHQSAAQAWLALGYISESLYHATQLDDKQTLLQILQQHAWQLFHQGELHLLEESLTCLDYQAFVHYPSLVLLKAWLAQSQHRHSEVNGIFAQFENVLQQHNIQLDKPQQAEFDVLRAQVAINQGEQNTALSLASDALHNLSANAYYPYIVATSIIGEAHHCNGNLEKALQLLQKTEQMAKKHHTYHNILWALLQQSEILSAQGFLQAAYDMLDKANIFVTQNHLQQLPMYEFLLRSKGKILWEWYNLDKAENMANAGMEVLNKQEDKLQCIILLSKISLVKGDLDNASRLLKQIETLQDPHHYHYDWIINADEIKILLWQMQNQMDAVQNWLTSTQKPQTDKNHFTQKQWRNIARAYIILGEFHKAEQILNQLVETAESLKLISDLNYALILRNRVYFLQEKKQAAQKDLIHSLQLAKQTNFISAFVIEGDLMAQQLRYLLQLRILDELELRRAQFILRHINQYYRHKFAHFDEQFVEQLLQKPEVPELLKMSPLTQREWQVLGLIYSGYSNEQISEELQVAITTIKTHIRNLYQKIGVTCRSEAITYTRKLLVLMGYN